MEHRRLGNSGLNVSEISYGNWITHGIQVEEEAAISCVHAALDSGITSFDTADAYAAGRAEEVLGAALSGQDRDSYVLSTKVYFPTGDGPNDRGLGRKHVLAACHASLKRLGTDFIDVYYAHRFDTTVPLAESMQAFGDLTRQGKINFLGTSEWNAAELAEGAELAREFGVQLIANQPQYSMLWRVIEPDVVPASDALGISQVVFSPVAQGVLTGKYLPGAPAPTGSRVTNEQGALMMRDEWMNVDTLRRVQELKPIAQEAGLSMAQLAIAWVLQNPNVASAIIGASRPEQIADNIKAAGVVLEEPQLAAIDKVLGDSVLRDGSQVARG